MINPYEKVNWQSVKRIGSATHMHMKIQKSFDLGYKYGIRHFPISNYYPSVPYNSDTKPSDFKLHQDWPARKKNGEMLEPPINWNDIITWEDKLDEKYRSQFPFCEGEKAFTNIPQDAIISPNAEHHNFCNLKTVHVCNLGSSFRSGNFDSRGHYHLINHDFLVGYGGTWQEGFECMLSDLIYPDGGGITINHPTWYSQLTKEEILEMLDFDERVLGIEIYNDSVRFLICAGKISNKAPDEMAPGFSLNLWDIILSAGRRCWGFCVPDHGFEQDRSEKWIGKSILLVPEATEYDCLKAYRLGQFYGCFKGENKENDLSVVGFSATETAISIEVNAPAEIKFITGPGIQTTKKGQNARFDIPQKGGKPSLTYLRIEVKDDSGERLFLQPIMFK